MKFFAEQQTGTEDHWNMRSRLAPFLAGFAAATLLCGVVAFVVYRYLFFDVSTVIRSPEIGGVYPDDPPLHADQAKQETAAFWAETGDRLTQVAQARCTELGIELKPLVRASGDFTAYLVVLGFEGHASFENFGSLHEVTDAVRNDMESSFWDGVLLEK